MPGNFTNADIIAVSSLVVSTCMGCVCGLCVVFCSSLALVLSYYAICGCACDFFFATTATLMGFLTFGSEINRHTRELQRVDQDLRISIFSESNTFRGLISTFVREKFTSCASLHNLYRQPHYSHLKCSSFVFNPHNVGKRPDFTLIQIKGSRIPLSDILNNEDVGKIQDVKIVKAFCDEIWNCFFELYDRFVRKYHDHENDKIMNDWVYLRSKLRKYYRSFIQLHDVTVHDEDVTRSMCGEVMKYCLLRVHEEELGEELRGVRVCFDRLSGFFFPEGDGPPLDGIMNDVCEYLQNHRFFDYESGKASKVVNQTLVELADNTEQRMSLLRTTSKDRRKKKSFKKKMKALQNHKDAIEKRMKDRKKKLEKKSKDRKKQRRDHIKKKEMAEKEINKSFFQELLEIESGDDDDDDDDDDDETSGESIQIIENEEEEEEVEKKKIKKSELDGEIEMDEFQPFFTSEKYSIHDEITKGILIFESQDMEAIVIVTCSADSTIKFSTYDNDSGNLKHREDIVPKEQHNKAVNCMIKIAGSTEGFLTCGEGGRILKHKLTFDIQSGKKTFVGCKSEEILGLDAVKDIRIRRISQIKGGGNEVCYLFSEGGKVCEMGVINHEDNGRRRIDNVRSERVLVSSVVHDKCVYTDAATFTHEGAEYKNENHPIIRINCEKSTIENVYQNHRFKVYGLSVGKFGDGVEMVVCGGRFTSKVFIYSSVDPKAYKTIDADAGTRSIHFWMYEENNACLLIGDLKGRLSRKIIGDFELLEGSLKCNEKDTKDSKIVDETIRCIEVLDPKTIFCTSRSGFILVVRCSSLY